jgi:hypothetical protein
MATDQQACGSVYRPTWRASALLAAAFFIFASAWAEAGSRRDDLVPIPRQAETETSLRGNPLWAVPLGALAQTRTRPIFSPSRRPPSPPVVAAAPPPPTPKAPPPKEPERLKLTLLGTVIGTSERIGVFLDETSKEIIRIRAGASHDGWSLSSLERRAASFEKDRQETTLTLPPPGTEQPASNVGIAAAKPGGVSISGNRGPANPPENRARPVALTLPASASTALTSHKLRQEIRQDILSIGVQN